MEGPTDKREAALAWARRGFKVFPLRAGTKLPMDKRWFEVATNDLEQVRRIWTDPVLGWPKDYNIGVLTDDLIVVDIDMKRGKDGLRSYLALGLPLDSLTVRTPSGGYHVYFTAAVPCASSVERIGPGLDIRGFHGFVVAPGSEVAGLGRYVLVSGDAARPAPSGLVAHLEAPRSDAADLRPVVELDAPAAIERARWLLDNELPPAVEGQHGDHTTYATAARLKDEGVSEDTALALMLEHWNERCSPPWCVDELRAKVENAYQYGKSPPGISDPSVHYGGLDLTALAVEPSPPRAVPGGAFYYHGDPWDINVNWLFDGVLPLTGVALLTGPSSSGKTFLAMEIARCVTTKAPFFGVPAAEQGAAIYLTSESLYSAKVRLAAVSGAMRLPIALRFVNGLSDKAVLQALVDDIAAEGRRQLDAFHMPPRLLVLDTLSAAGLLLDENSNAEAAAAMAALARVAMDLNLLVLVLHHPPKHGQGERGAAALRNSADYVLNVEREDKSPVRQLVLSKSRDGPDGHTLGSFTLPTVVVTKDSKGKDVVSCVVSLAEAPARVPDSSKYTELLVDCIRWGLIEQAEEIEGHQYVELDVVKEFFSDRKTGSRGPKVISNTFKGALDLALETGIVESYAWQGRSYLALRSLLT